MKDWDVIELVAFVHQAFVYDNLLNRISICKMIIKLKSFNELLLCGCISFIRLKKWSASCCCLKNFHVQIFDMVVMIIQYSLTNCIFILLSIWIKSKISSNIESVFKTLVVLLVVIVSRQFKESSWWWLFKRSCCFNPFFKSLDWVNLLSIYRSRHSHVTFF